MPGRRDPDRDAFGYGYAVRDVAATFLRGGHLKDSAGAMFSFAEIKQILGVDAFVALRDSPG